MLAGAEEAALATTGGAEVLVSDYEDIWRRVTV